MTIRKYVFSLPILRRNLILHYIKHNNGQKFTAHLIENCAMPYLTCVSVDLKVKKAKFHAGHDIWNVLLSNLLS